MSCSLDDVEALAYGELPAARGAAVARHVAGCSACAAELAALRAERQLFFSAPGRSEPLPDLAPVLARARRAPARRRASLAASAPLLAAAALALLVTGRARPSAEPAPTAPHARLADDLPGSDRDDGLASFDDGAGVCGPVALACGENRPRSVTEAPFTPLPREACE